MRLSLLAIAVLLFGSSLTASADTVYTYTGAQLYYAGLPFSDNNYIRGEFTTASPLTPNASNYSFGITSLEFTDGENPLDLADGDFLYGNFYVNGAGQITDWNFDITGFNAPFSYHSSRNPLGPTGYYDFDFYAYNSDFYAYSYAPGSFTTSATPGSITPEPPAFYLLGTGLLGVFGAFRRRLASTRSLPVRP